MLSVARCRELLGSSGESLSDSVIENLRGELVTLAESLAVMAEASPLSSSSGRLKVIESLPRDVREAFEERAAIMQADGGLSLGAAERAALLLLVPRSK
jgi:hypothetical protein